MSGRSTNAQPLFGRAGLDGDSPQLAIAFDMDGVVFQTTLPKRDAMLSLFPASRREELAELVMSLAGIPRRPKLAAVHRACFGQEVTEMELTTYLQSYETALASVLDKPRVMPGVAEFLHETDAMCFVCSSAPEAEVQTQLERAGLRQYFGAVYGAPTSKREALQQIARQCSPAALVFFGDAPADLAAARAVDCAFIAVVGESDQFHGSAPFVIRDFANRSDVEAVLAACFAGLEVG